MTELEKIAYAKSFIDKLANGINPLDGTPVSDTDIVNNVRISRCLFYVSNILSQVIENGGTKLLKRSEKLPFAISEDQLAKYQYSERPLSVSEIAKQINSFIDQSQMRTLTAQDITKWLVQVGALYEQENLQGRKHKRPTEAGRQLGISTELRMGLHGEYTAVIYDKNAQALIIDNMEAILSLKNNLTANESGGQKCSEN